MMDLSFDEVINTEEYDELGDLPPGVYKVFINDAKKISNKDPATGAHLYLEMSIIDGEHEGRKTSTRINAWHRDANVKRFACAQIKSICISIWGADQRIASADVFLDRFCAVKMALGKEYQGERRCEVKEFIPLAKWNNIVKTQVVVDEPPPF